MTNVGRVRSEGHSLAAVIGEVWSDERSVVPNIDGVGSQGVALLRSLATVKRHEAGVRRDSGQHPRDLDLDGRSDLVPRIYGSDG